MVDKDQVISALRATLISVQGALTLKQCNNDYRELQGEWIPYRKLGYSSLDKLFLDVPGFKVTQVNGEYYVDAVAKQESQHIASMVARQKTKKKSIKSSYQKRYHDVWRKPTSVYSSNYNSEYSNKFYKSNDTPPRYNKVPYKYPNTRYDNNKYNNNKYDNNKYDNNKYDNNKYDNNKYDNNKYDNNKYDNNKYDNNKYDNNKYDNNKYDNNKYDNNKYENTKYDSKPLAPSKPLYKPAQKTEHDTRKPDPTIVAKPAATRMLSADNKLLVNEAKPKSAIEPLPKSAPLKRSKLSASQRLTNLRESLAIDSIPLITPALNDKAQYELESNPSDPTPEPVSPVPEPPPPNATSVDKLAWICRKLQLPQPEYKITPGKPFYCNVKVNASYSALSYPESSPSEELARELAALKLLTTIEGSHSDLPHTPPDLATANLLRLVTEHTNGLVSTTIPHLYREKYKENLPSNWQKLVENCPDFVQENTGFNMFLLRVHDAFNNAASPESETASYEDAVDIPPLQFPDDNFWNVVVMVCNSSVEIWIRILGDEYNVELDKLLDEMLSYYTYSGLTVDETIIVPNAWYAVFIEDDGWQRGKVLEVIGDKVNVFLGDRGDEETVPISKLKILEPHFMKLPLQAILCRLEGLEELATSEAGREAVQTLLGYGPLVAEVGPCVDPSDPHLPVVLYDTSTEHDINLNHHIRDQFCQAAEFGVEQLGQLCEVDVRCVTDDGLVWVSRAGSAAAVDAALSLLTSPGPYRRPLPASPAAPAPHQHTLYMVRTYAGDWVRCTIRTGLDGEGTVRTLLVDSGLVMRAPASSLVPLEAFSDVLSRYPRQAIQVRLDGPERLFKSMSARLREILLGCHVICRTAPSAATSHAAGLPLVELYIRTNKNILASVRSALIAEAENKQSVNEVKEEQPQSTTDQVEALHRKKERIFSRSASANLPNMAANMAATNMAGKALSILCPSLPAPELPAVGKYFDVFVAMAANPSNFVVQKNSERGRLQRVMESLQSRCGETECPPAAPPPPPGTLAAALYPQDNTWYRVAVIDVISSDMVSVYFCDFGDMAPLPTTALRPLPNDDPLLTTLPPQAIRATLHGVKPAEQDWTVEDCVRFHELTVEKQLVGICHGLGADPLRPGGLLLTLELVNTDGDEDLYLSLLLVKEGRALSTTTNTNTNTTNTNTNN